MPYIAKVTILKKSILENDILIECPRCHKKHRAFTDEIIAKKVIDRCAFCGKKFNAVLSEYERGIVAGAIYTWIGVIIGLFVYFSSHK
jgi:DNA-directed RNA polymerase subunit RPC12/RpoP